MSVEKFLIGAVTTVIVVISLISCTIVDNNNYYNLRQVCVENGGSVITRHTFHNGRSYTATNCELTEKATERDYAL